MSLDNRKKKEELQEVVQEAVAEPVEEIVLEEPPVESLKENINVEEPIKEPEVEVPEVVEDKEEKVEPPSPDYKEKYSESSKESLTQYFKNKKLTETVDEASNLPEPTDEDVRMFLASKKIDYEYLDDSQKAMWRETLHSKLKFDKVQEVVTQSKDIDAWSDKVDAFTNSVETVAKYPLVEENAEDFKKFCMKSARRGMDLEDLTTSFLYGLTNAPVKKPSKNSMLLSGTGGGKTEKPVGLSDEDVKNIRLSNPKELRRLIKAGKINIEI
jgi:hypothetical protein